MAGGKKSKSKKKTKISSATAPGAPAPAPDPGPGPSAGEARREAPPEQRTYYKIKATFKCSKDTCGKLWTSVHAWERDEDIYCDFCEGRAQVEKFLDEMCELDNYNCPNCPGEHWQSIHNEENREEECGKCGTSVRPEGTQRRFGRHYWFSCTECKVEWEDCSINPQRTQRCSKCRSRGDVIKTVKIHPRRRGKPGEGGDGPGGGGQHNWEYCDMCADLKGQGKGQTCIQFRKVKCKVIQLAEGVFTERITEVK